MKHRYYFKSKFLSDILEENAIIEVKYKHIYDFSKSLYLIKFNDRRLIYIEKSIFGFKIYKETYIEQLTLNIVQNIMSYTSPLHYEKICSAKRLFLECAVI